MSPARHDSGRGCEYCAEDGNMFFGHVDQVASSDTSHTLLLCCPRCGSLYELAARGPVRVTRLTAADAAAKFPGWESSHTAGSWQTG